MPAALQTVLVTGATGFIGRSLLDRLAVGPQRVRAAIRADASGLPPGIERVQVGDIGPTTDWNAALRGADAVVHLAARAHVLRDASPATAELYRTVNTLGTLRLAGLAVASGARRFIFLSSVRAHAERTEGRPLREDAPLAATDVYGKAKAEAETALAKLAQGTPLETVVLRPPLVYGPAVRGNFARLARLIARGVPLPLGAVRNRRSLLFVDNLVDAIVRCLDHPAAAGQSFLLSDGEDVSTPDLLRRLGRALGTPARLFSVPVPMLRVGSLVLGRSDDANRLLDDLAVDSSRIRTMLQWAPPHTLDEGLAAYAAWYQKGSR